jgi:DNA-binding CsgD family transcriptional regulator
VTRGTLVGRDELRLELAHALRSAKTGRGQLLLLSGEAGVGKTRLATEALAAASGVRVLTAPAGPQDAYAPLVAVLRHYRRTSSDASPFEGALGEYLRALMPELGPAPPTTDRATLVEALRVAVETIAARQPIAIFLDDLHESDSATLEVLPQLAAVAELGPLLILGAYRGDEVGRDHPLRGMRTVLRRAGRLHEVHVEPLGPDASAALAEQALGQPLAPTLTDWLFERTQGLPLFIEELAGLLRSSRAVREMGGRLELAQSSPNLPVPETVRDLVLLRTERLADATRSALEVAAVAGVTFDLDLVARLGGGEQALGEALASGLLVESGERCGAFRHPLIRDVIYADIAWPRRRALHRLLAEQLERGACSAIVLAEHWLAGRELERARDTLLKAAQVAAGVHAYRDAAASARRALELWPEGRDDAERVAVLDHLGHWAQLTGSLTDAIGAWRQVAHAHAAAGNLRAYAVVQRQMAAIFELQGVWDAALSAREAAANAFAQYGECGEAAAERLAVAGHLRSAATFAPALEILEVAAREAAAAGRVDLQARVLGHQGNARTRLGEYDVGLELVRAGLALALEHNQTAAAADVYQRLADSLEHRGDAAGARQAYAAAAEFCQIQGASAVAQLCLACMTVVLRQNGDWIQCERICREVIASSNATGHARAVALGMLGSVLLLRGDVRRARPLVSESARLAQHIELAAMELLSAWGLAMLDDLDGRPDRAVERCWGLLERWSRTQERHFVVPALRWAATLFSTRSDASGARACADGLARIVAQVADLEAVAALAHALGEVSLCEGDAGHAADHFEQACERLAELDLPYERAHSSLRAGTALLAAGRRDLAAGRLQEAQRLAQSLGALPVAAAAARQLVADGQTLAASLLSRREHEVALLLAEGCTNREIADRLVISERTAENHVQRIMNRMGLRSRTQIAAWAVQNGAVRV